MTMDLVTLLLLIRRPLTGRVPVLDSPCVVEVIQHSHAVGLRGAPYRTTALGQEARNHGPCTVHHPRTEQATSCSVNTRATPRRAELAAARPLPSSGSPTIHGVSLCAAATAQVCQPQTFPRRSRPPVAQTPAAQARPSPYTPRRPVYAPGQSPDAAGASSRHFPHRKRETYACNTKFRARFGGGNLPKRKMHPLCRCARPTRSHTPWRVQS